MCIIIVFERFYWLILNLNLNILVFLDARSGYRGWEEKIFRSKILQGSTTVVTICAQTISKNHSLWMQHKETLSSGMQCPRFSASPTPHQLSHPQGNSQQRGVCYQTTNLPGKEEDVSLIFFSMLFNSHIYCLYCKWALFPIAKSTKVWHFDCMYIKPFLGCVIDVFVSHQDCYWFMNTATLSFLYG